MAFILRSRWKSSSPNKLIFIISTINELSLSSTHYSDKLKKQRLGSVFFECYFFFFLINAGISHSSSSSSDFPRSEKKFPLVEPDTDCDDCVT